MTRDDTKNVIGLIIAAYPNYHPENMTATVDLWWKVFEDAPVEQVAAATTAYITTNTSGFAPTIAEVRQLLIPETQEMGELEAWEIVAEAVKKSNYYAEEEFEKMPEAIQEALGGPGTLRQWANTPSDAVATVAQSNFLRSYRAVIKRQKQDRLIPESVKKILEKTTKAIEQHAS